MTKFSSLELKEKLIEELQLVEKTFGALNHLLHWGDGPCDLNQLLLGQFEEGEEDEIVIDNDTLITLHPDGTDDYEIYQDVSIQNFFDIMESYRTIRTVTLGKCTSPNVAFYVIDVGDKDYIMQQIFSDYNGFENDEAEFYSDYKGKKIKCSLVSGITLFGLKVLETKQYNEYFPPVSYQDFFIKIEGEDLTDEDYDEIVNAFIFELSAFNIINLSLSVRPEYPEDEEIGDFLSQTGYMRPLLFGKGISDIIKTYNQALESDDIDRKIIQYTKVIEYASQTVIRSEKTERIQCKLNSLRSLKADANYIKELEQAFDDLKDKYAKDSDAIKATILRCCDIEEICEQSPNYLKKIKELKKHLIKEKVNRGELIDAAKIELAQSISDTRNEIAHAKANYVPKGKECPEDEKDCFAEMIRVLSSQVIQWYANVHENQRITSNS